MQNTDKKLKRLRRRIDMIDTSILSSLGKRMTLSRDIGAYKRAQGLQLKDAKRLQKILATRATIGAKKKLSPAFVRSLFTHIHRESVRQQKKS